MNNKLRKDSLSQRIPSLPKLSYLELKWFYSLGRPEEQDKFLLHLNDTNQQMVLLMQKLDKIVQKLDHNQQPKQAKFYHASVFLNTWFGFIIANTLLDPIKPVILETIKTAIPKIGIAANTILNYTASLSKAIRDSLGKL